MIIGDVLTGSRDGYAIYRLLLTPTKVKNDVTNHVFASVTQFSKFQGEIEAVIRETKSSFQNAK